MFVFEAFRQTHVKRIVRMESAGKEQLFIGKIRAVIGRIKTNKKASSNHNH